MEWTRSETLVLAVNSCVACNGLGLRTSEKDGEATPCGCVLRNVFRACFTRFRECVEKEKFISRVSLEAIQGRDHHGTWSRKDEEYIADFTLLSKRSLTESEYQLFRYHFLLGADWKLCCRKLKMDRGTFFHSVYKIQQKLGRLFATVEPYALYPLADYFRGGSKDVTPVRFIKRTVIPIRPPVKTRSCSDNPVRKAA